MRVMKNKATLLCLAVAGLFAASAAQAVVDLDAPTPTVVKFASEAAVPAGGLVLTNTGASLDITFKLGFGISTGQQKYIRIDLTNAIFNAALTGANLTDATNPLGNSVVVQGGQIGDAYVTFQVTGGAAPQTALDQMTVAMPASIKALATSSNVGVAYGLHDTAVSAAQPPTNVTRLISKTGVDAFFAPAVGITVLGSVAETAAATQTFKLFCSGAGNTPGTPGCAAATTDAEGLIGAIATYALNANVLDPATGMAVTFLNVPVAATSNVVLTGSDLSGASRTYQSFVGASTVGSCNGGGTTGTTAATTATFVVGNTAQAAGINSLCMTANGTSSIPAQLFTGVYNRVGNGAAWTSGTISLGQTGQINRDGVELQTPWFTLGGTGSAYISRFFLTNTGTAAATCTVSFLSETGNTITANTTPNAQGNSAAGVTVPGGGQVAVLATDLITSFSGSARAAVRFSCPAPSANMQGTYVLTHTSGAVSTGSMLRPGTN